MTGEQRRLYAAAIRIGRAWSVGGNVWTYYPPPIADNITMQAVVRSDGTRTLYIVRERLVVYGQPMPPGPSGDDKWRLIAPVDTDISTGGIVVSGAFAFTIGPLDIDQGYPTGIVERTTTPIVNTTPIAHLRQGLQIGLRIGF